MKTPISYYGGKQSMLQYILPLIPAHNAYVEPFFGGGAVFWSLEKPAKLEIINDSNGFVINFYEQLKNNFSELKKAVDATMFSRDVHRRAMTIYYFPYLFGAMEKAWAFWVATNQGFNHQIGSWRNCNMSAKEALKHNNSRLRFTEELADRLKHTHVENLDALEIIRRFDRADTFFYIDPPYIGANQGHYGGYTQEHFDALLNTLPTIKGKFLLSSYPNDKLAEMTAQHGWWSKPIEMFLTASNKGKKKIEMLTRNYAIK